MSNIFIILMILPMLAVVGSLFVGLFSMARGGEGDGKQSNRMMRYRVIFQGIALLLFALAILTQAS